MCLPLVSVGRGFYRLNKLPTLGTLINTAYESDAMQFNSFDTIMMTLLGMYVTL